MAGRQAREDTTVHGGGKRSGIWDEEEAMGEARNYGVEVGK